MIPKNHLDSLTDGVFAVAMTLLVIDIKLPETVHPRSAGELIDALAGLDRPLMAYVLSFIVLGLRWLGLARAAESAETASLSYARWTLVHLVSCDLHSILDHGCRPSWQFGAGCLHLCRQYAPRGCRRASAGFLRQARQWCHRSVLARRSYRGDRRLRYGHGAELLLTRVRASALSLNDRAVCISLEQAVADRSSMRLETSLGLVQYAPSLPWYFLVGSVITKPTNCAKTTNDSSGSKAVVSDRQNTLPGTYARPLTADIL
jgi:hypothetical protein